MHSLFKNAILCAFSYCLLRKYLLFFQITVLLSYIIQQLTLKAKNETKQALIQNTYTGNYEHIVKTKSKS